MVSDEIADRIDFGSLTGEVESGPAPTTKGIPVCQLGVDDELILGPLVHVSPDPLELQVVLPQEHAMRVLQVGRIGWAKVLMAEQEWHREEMPEHRITLMPLADGTVSVSIIQRAKQ